jgi:hypothetical protein
MCLLVGTVGGTAGGKGKTTGAEDPGQHHEGIAESETTHTQKRSADDTSKL